MTLQRNYDEIQITRDDLPNHYQATAAADAFSFGGVNLTAVISNHAATLYGVVVQPEDVPTFVADYPTDDLPPTSLLSHTSAFPSKFDLRGLDDGRVLTQINFGSIPNDARILDLRGREPGSVFSNI